SIRQLPPDDDFVVIEYRVRIQPDHSHDRLVLRRDVKRAAGCGHACTRNDYGVDWRKRLIPGLKITFPSTTTSSSSRNNCTAFESVRASRSRPFRLTSSIASTPTLMWNTS